MRTPNIIASAEFDHRLPRYFMLQTVAGLAVAIFTIPLIPIWLIFGMRVHKKQYENLSAALTDSTLNIHRGILFKVQMSIPLDKITDLAVNEGPILRYLGLCSLKIETAGGQQGSAMGHANLPGVVNALEFRDKVLDQRDMVSGRTAPGAPTLPPAAAATPVEESSRELLAEIRDLLQKIADRGAG